MKRRRARRRSRRSPLTIVALALATAVVVAAVALIVRGDTTPRAHHGTARHHGTSAGVASAARPAGSSASTSSASSASSASSNSASAAERAAQAGATDAPAAAVSGAPAASQQPGAAPTAAPPDGAPRLAIIIDDCGQWPDTERGFIALPAALTLSVLPHMRYGAQIARDASAAGKGVMLHLPMEPRSGKDPGQGGILTSMDDAAIEAQVRDDLAAMPLATGVNNHEGSRATADDRVMRDVVAVLAQRHVFFIDSRTGSDTVAERNANAAGVPTARRDVFLDDVADVDATESQLRRAAEIAKTKGSAIAIGHPRPTTLIAVRTLLPELERDGIVLVLAGDLVR
jgi:polysaccharide deacetylase 2 family uncharacterized protein YibQ